MRAPIAGCSARSDARRRPGLSTPSWASRRTVRAGAEEVGDLPPSQKEAGVLPAARYAILARWSPYRPLCPTALRQLCELPATTQRAMTDPT